MIVFIKATQSQFIANVACAKTANATRIL